MTFPIRPGTSDPQGIALHIHESFPWGLGPRNSLLKNTLHINAPTLLTWELATPYTGYNLTHCPHETCWLIPYGLGTSDPQQPRSPPYISPSWSLGTSLQMPHDSPAWDYSPTS